MPKENQDTQLLHKAVAHLKEYGVNGVDQICLELQRLSHIYSKSRIVEAIESELLPVITRENLQQDMAHVLVHNFTSGAKSLRWESPPDLQLIAHMAAAAETRLDLILCLLCVFSASEGLRQDKEILRVIAVNNSFLFSHMICAEAERQVQVMLRMTAPLSAEELVLEEEIRKVEYEIASTRQHYSRAIEYLGRLATRTGDFQGSTMRLVQRTDGSSVESSGDADSTGPTSASNDTSEESEDRFEVSQGENGDQAVCEGAEEVASLQSSISASAHTHSGNSSASTDDPEKGQLSSIPGIDDMSSDCPSADGAARRSTNLFTRIWRRSFQRKAKSDSSRAMIPEASQVVDQKVLSAVLDEEATEEGSDKGAAYISRSKVSSGNLNELHQSDNLKTRDLVNNSKVEKDANRDEGRVQDCAQRSTDASSDDESAVLEEANDEAGRSTDASSDDVSTVNSETYSTTKNNQPGSTSTAPEWIIPKASFTMVNDSYQDPTRPVDTTRPQLQLQLQFARRSTSHTPISLASETIHRVRGTLWVIVVVSRALQEA